MRGVLRGWIRRGEGGLCDRVKGWVRRVERVCKRLKAVPTDGKKDGTTVVPDDRYWKQHRT